MIKRNLQLTPSSTNDSGFTIIESILGILIAAILLAAISPVLVMSTAIRVQSRRIEQATQAANTFIDGIKTGSIKPLAVNKIELDKATAEAPRQIKDSLMSIEVMPVPTNAENLYRFKNDGVICYPLGEIQADIENVADLRCSSNNTSEEYYIQATQIVVKGSTANDGYRLAVRVYRGDVDFNKPLLASTKDNSGNTSKQTASVVTAGLGNKQAPLIERTVDIGNVTTTFQALCQRLGLAPDKDGKQQNCQ